MSTLSTSNQKYTMILKKIFIDAGIPESGIDSLLTKIYSGIMLTTWGKVYDKASNEDKVSLTKHITKTPHNLADVDKEIKRICTNLKIDLEDIKEEASFSYMNAFWKDFLTGLPNEERETFRKSMEKVADLDPMLKSLKDNL